MMQSPDIEVREYRPGDEESILRGFNRAFSRVDPNFVPRDLETWTWIYRRNPAGLRIWLGLDESGEVVNQQAGIPVRVRQDGRVVLWTQVVDSFTDPDLTRGLKKPGLFIRAATPFWQNYGGPAPDQDSFQYGIPIRSAFRIGKKFLGYAAFRHQCALRSAGTDARVTSRDRSRVRVEEVSGFDDEVDAFFERATRTRRAIVVRNQEHLNWRYVGRPDRSYRIAVARSVHGDLLGYAIHRHGVLDGQEGGLLCDWLVEPGNASAADSLRAWALERTREDGASTLTSLTAETAPEWVEFQRAGFRVTPTSYYIGAKSYRPGYDARWAYWNWYYTMGDFDLC